MLNWLATGPCEFAKESGFEGLSRSAGCPSGQYSWDHPEDNSVHLDLPFWLACSLILLSCYSILVFGVLFRGLQKKCFALDSPPVSLLALSMHTNTYKVFFH